MLRCSASRSVKLVAGLVFACLLVAGTGSAEDPIEKINRLSAAAKSLPLWKESAPSEVLELSRQARTWNKSVLIIGNAKDGYGTGFVISREHRLVATNAHVADIRYMAEGKLLAIVNGTADVFPVEHIWYHPGVTRRLSSGANVRSQEAADGLVVPSSADVAVLQLGGSAELPPEMTLATPDEAFDLFAQPVGMVGFPGHDTVSWPALGEAASATYRQGAIARATDFRNNANASQQDLQYLQHTMASWFGFSGSPIFLQNGHVVALNNSGRKVQKDGFVTALAFGVRVDCLWELLAWHELTDLIPIPVPPDQLRLARFEAEDPGLKQHAQVLELVGRGEQLFEERRYVEAGAAFREAIALAPNFADAHDWKAVNHHEFALNQANSRELKLEQQQKAIFHYEQALALEPGNPWRLANVLGAQINYADYLNGYVDHLELRAACRRFLELPNLEDSLKAFMYRKLGATYALAAQRIHFTTAAIKLDPYNAVAYESRARNFRAEGNLAAANADQNHADRLRKANIDNLRAWELIESDNELGYRDAIRLATSACHATSYKHWPFLQTLAVSHYAAGENQQALRRIQECYALCPENAKAEIAVKLPLYQAELMEEESE